MAYGQLSTRALVLFVLSFGVTANPVNIDNLDARAPAAAADVDPEKISPCATVRCGWEATCQVIGGKAVCVPPNRQVCGQVVCAEGLTCCNASCNTCVKPGMMCTQQVCPPVALEPVPSPVPVPPVVGDRICGPTICPRGQECCNSSCGYCVVPGSGKGCTKELCAPPQVKCGKTLCPKGNVCCNSSCGVCTPPGGACTQQFCGPVE